MKAVAFVMILAVAAASVAAQPAKNTPEKEKTIVVQIVIGTAEDLKKECMHHPTTIVVIGTEAYHCIKGKLLSHQEADKTGAAVVELSVGQRIQWKSERAFAVVRVERHGMPVAGTPNDPFSGNPFSNKLANEVTSGTVVDLDGDKQQRYKATFQIEKVGLVDPDFICSM